MYVPRFFGATDAPTSPAGISSNSPTTTSLAELPLLRTIPGYGETASAALSPDGKLAAAAYYDGMIKVWLVDEDTLLSTMDVGTTVTSLAISADNQLIAAGLTSAVVRGWRSDGTELPIFEGLTDIVYSVAFSPDGQMLAAGDTANVMVWRVSDGTILQTFGGHSNNIGRVVFSPDNQWLASAARGHNTVNLWRMDTNVLVHDLEADYDTAAAFSPDSDILATGGVYLWRVRDGERLQEMKGHTQPVATLAFSPDGQTLVSVSPGIEVRRWQMSDGRRLYTRRLDGTNVQSVELSTDGKVLMALYQDGKLKIWQIP
jgi:WD40 repeat protein